MHAASTPNFLSAQALEANAAAASTANLNAAAATAQQPQHTQPLASYTGEEMAFHKLFPHVPLSEKLVESFQCGLSRKKIVRMGRMYLTSLRICFHSSFMKESVTIDWDQVIGVAKKSNFVFEAVVVEVNGGERHFFSAFMYGVTDQAHKLMTMLWTVRSKYGGVAAPEDIAALTAASGGPAGAAAAAANDDDAAVGENADEDTVVVAPAAAAAASESADAQPAVAEGAGGSRSAQPSPARVRPSAPTDASFDSRPTLEKPQGKEDPRQTSPLPGSGASKSRRETSNSNSNTAQELQTPTTQQQQQQRAAAPARPVTPPAQRGAPEQSVPDIFKHFPSVSKSETVVDRFQCSYVSGVHRLGGLYITTNYILFHSLMMSEGVMIKFSDVASIEKEQTIIILDGIVVTTKAGVAHSFTSFVSRDAAYNILVHFFGPHKNKAAKEKQAAAAAGPAAVEPVTSSSSTSAAVPTRTPPESPLSAPAVAAGGAQPAITALPPAGSSGNGGGGGGSIFRTSTSTSSFDSFPRCSSINEFSKVQTDFGTGLSPVENFVKEICPTKDLPKGFSVIDVFKELFDDETSFLDEYHEQRQDTARTWEPWRAALPGSPPSSGQRKLLCTTIIRAVFATACPFTEFQRYALMNVNGTPTLLVQFSGQAVGVMFADSFRAETLLIFTQNVATGIVSVRVMGHIQFLRNVWVKGKILSTALDVEMPDCYQTLINMAIKRLSKALPSAAGGPSAAPAADAVPAPSLAAQEQLPAASSAPATAPAAVTASTSSVGARATQPQASDKIDEGVVKHVTVALCLLGLFFSIRGLLSSLTFNTDYYFSALSQSSAAGCSSAKQQEGAADLGCPSPALLVEMTAAAGLASAVVDLLRPVVVASLCCTSVYFIGKLRNLLL